MKITIAECRKLLGEIAEKMSDNEILELRNAFIVLADLAIDTYLAKKKPQRKEKEYVLPKS